VGTVRAGLPWRAVLARAAGVLTARTLRLLRRSGTTLPGRVALRLDPHLPETLAARLPQGVTVVSGTNGKTTTTAMLAEMLAARGWQLAHNRGGANLRTGLTAALLGAPRADIGLLEVDEGTMPFAGRLHPRVAVVTNFFRDQLDRYGELQAAVARVQSGLAGMGPEGVAVLNADDPLVAALAASLHSRVLLFGVEAQLGSWAAPDAAPSDAPPCPVCAAPLVYASRHYAHVGHYRCPVCAYARPTPDVRVVGWRPPLPGIPGALELETPVGPWTQPVALPGSFNAYNAAAAVAAALALGLLPADIAPVLARFRHAFGRMEWFLLDGRRCCLLLVKNPTGLSLALRTAIADPLAGGALALILNDATADGTDISWIWDADVEALAAAQGRFRRIVAAGRRAADMALRLKYAGVTPERLVVVADPLAAVRTAAAAVGDGPVYVLPTYTAMLQLRGTLARVGILPPFWEVEAATLNNAKTR
jgi:UDP-N-acetylmuramyl tripeptide synthase